MADQRRAGLIQVQANGEVLDAKGTFTCGYGRPKREAIIGADGVHGFKEVPQPGFVEGAITDRGSLDIAALVSARDLTITVQFTNGKVFVLRDAWFAGDGQITTEEAEIAVRWEGANAEEIS